MFATGILVPGGIALLAGVPVPWLCGLVSGLMSMVSVVSGIGFALGGNHHDGVIALGYPACAAAPFALIVVLTCHHGRLTDAAGSGRSLGRVGKVRLLSQDASFEAATPR